MAATRASALEKITRERRAAAHGPFETGMPPSPQPTLSESPDCRVSEEPPLSRGVATPFAALIRHPAPAIPQFSVAAVEAYLQYWRSALV